MKQPEHLAGPAFDKARDKIAFLETQLTESQKSHYEAFVKAQDKEKEEQKRKAAKAKAEYDQAKDKRPGAVKNYDPPIKIKDPYLRKMALDAQDEHNKVTALERTQLAAKVQFLEKLEQQREDQTRTKSSPESDRAAAEQHPKARQDFSQAAAAGRAKTDFEKAAPPAKESALARAFDRAARKDQEQEKDRARHDPGKDRDRSS